MDKLDLPNGMSVIARTAGIGRSVDELQWDLNYLMQLWRAIEGAGQSAPGAFLIYQESSLVIRAIRDYFQPDIGEILIDTDDIYEQAHQFMTHVMPDMVHRVKRYRDDVPLFSRFQIEHQIETAYSRTVPLPSGGAIVIDHTEALVSVDVNSARATRGSDIETTAFNTNLEAADEVARQLRLRDLGGLIVIDFIDMENSKNQREVETRLKDALHYDRARVQMGKISRFGLMELSRQRLRPSLSEGSHVTCPRCNGTGHIRDTESSALQVLRIIQEEAMKENSAAIHVQSPVDVAAFLLNEKRGEILKIETRHRVSVILIPNKHLETPHYKLERIKHDDPRLEDVQASYAMAEQADTDIGYSKRQKEDVKPRQEAMVKGITPDQPAPIVERKPVEAATVPTAVASAPAPGFLSKILSLFFKKPAEPVTPPVAPAVKPQQARDRNERNGRGGQRGRNRGNRSNRESGDEKEVPKSEQRQDAVAKQALTDSPTAAPAPRAPRPPREGNEGRRERHERQPRAREERKEVAGAKADEPLLNNEATIAAVPGTTAAAAVSPIPNMAAPSEEAQVAGNGPEAETGEQSEEQRRRRRRRGGRNRNRRERENGEPIDGENGVETIEAALAESHVAETQVITETTTTVAIIEAAPSAAAPEAIAPFSQTASEQQESPAPVAESVEAAGEAEVQPAGAETAQEQAVAAPSVAMPAVEEAVEKVAAPAEAGVPASVASAPFIVSRPSVAAAPMPIADLQAVLQSAGLTLAMTDPEKLRAAQEAAARIVPPARVPRVRKVLPPLSTEPLIQVETRR
jgi:ribonuclease E